MKKVFWLSPLLVTVFLFGCTHFNWCTPKNENYIKDNKGRIVIYHGINVSNFSKDNTAGGYLPWQSESDYALLNKWGFNLVRYLVFWHAVEPLEGMINQTYLKSTIEEIQKLQRIGVDVVVDLHQDLYGPVPGFCGGNGFPAWTANKQGQPFECQTPWSKNYLQPAMLACYDHFWHSSDLKEKYVNYVRLIYSALDTISNVVGFDVMNEPFPALPPNTKKLTGKHELQDVFLAKEVAQNLIDFETKILPSLYDQIRDRTTEFSKPMWFEPAIWTSSGIPSILNYVPGKSHVYFPHYYDVQVHESKPYTATVKKIMNIEVKETVLSAKRFGVPVLFGEFGAPMTAQGYLDYLSDFLDLLDQYNIGWTYYTFDRGHPFGVLDVNGVETPHMTKLVRVYPQKIAGVSPKYGIVGNVFTLKYNHTINAETEIFIPPKLKVVVRINDNSVAYISGILKWNQTGFTKIEVKW